MTPSDGPRPSVLVVEDEQDLGDLYATWLEDAYDVQLAYNGADALELVTDAVDVVLLDRRMPECTGDEVLHEIRQRGLECRVVMVTAVEPAFDIVGMGFDDYLTKPVSPAELRGAVESVLARRQYDSQVQELFALYSTRRVLEAENVNAGDREDDGQLHQRIATLEASLDDRLRDFDDEDFRAAFLTLEGPLPHRPGGRETVADDRSDPH